MISPGIGLPNTHGLGRSRRKLIVFIEVNRKGLPRWIQVQTEVHQNLKAQFTWKIIIKIVAGQYNSRTISDINLLTIGQ